MDKACLRANPRAGFTTDAVQRIGECHEGVIAIVIIVVIVVVKIYVVDSALYDVQHIAWTDFETATTANTFFLIKRGHELWRPDYAASRDAGDDGFSAHVDYLYLTGLKNSGMGKHWNRSDSTV